jgi:two-component system response regulator QseB
MAAITCWMSGRPEPVFGEDGEAVLHQLVVVRLVAGRAAKLRNAGARGEFDPDFGDEDAFKVEADDLHGKLPGGEIWQEGAILPNPLAPFDFRCPPAPLRSTHTMRVLLVEDDPMIGKSVQQGLRQNGYTIDWVRDGQAGELALATTDYEMLLLDLGLPGKSGLEVLARLRRAANRIPVLVITARDSVADRIKGLDTGADDYLVKPFDLDELSARMRAVLRRHAGRADPVIALGDLRMNPATHELTQNGQPVQLSAREFALLRALLEQPGTPLSRAKLEERLYGWGEEVESNAVEVYIHSLRRKLGAERIRNIRGVGYLVPLV